MLLAGGTANLAVVADFDRTMSGAKSISAHGVLERVDVFDEEFQKLTQANTAKYYPIEIDPNLTIEQKLPHMRDWYEKNHAAMASQNITKPKISEAVRSANVIMREKSLEVIDFVQRAGIPLLIFSAGLGDIIEEVLEFKMNEISLKLEESTKVVSNRMVFRGEELVGFSEPLIHMFNKNQGAVPVELQPTAPNQILMGDGYGDRTMCDGAETPADVLLKFGFLNDHVDEKLESYLDAFDIVIVDDGSMECVLKILEGVLEIEKNNSK
ncbi:hypothetical protein TrST_g3511 [Triparma strigata]|uniref:5'-nucleotidase n=1 Tax=Triparma strigata TaxID=1606541 RepID=A0A9W7BFR7_9STRA|nr:hypothetical protein TrST_g3511 [Triparma strigata]